MKKRVMTLCIVMSSIFAFIGCQSSTNTTNGSNNPTTNNVVGHNINNKDLINNVSVSGLDISFPSYDVEDKRCVYIDDDKGVRVDIMGYPDVEKRFEENEKINQLIEDNLTSMDDKGAYCYNLMAQTLYYDDVTNDKIIETGSKKGFYTINDIKIFRIYDLSSEKYAHCEYNFLYEEETDSIIIIRCFYNDDNGQKITNDILDTMSANTTYDFPKTIETELLIWRE